MKDRPIHLISTHVTDTEIKALEEFMQENGFTSKAALFRTALNAYIGKQIFRPRDYSLQAEMTKQERWVEKGSEPFEEWKFKGGKVVLNTDKQRIQIFFDSKPDMEQRHMLKLHHFIWIPSLEVWQRPLTRSALRFTKTIDFLKPL